ncbi:DNA polymerase [Candidatus Marinarcus aquaticus]|nr:DNA polymerase [Candidatus Marinarcus aquaticus]
MSDIYMHFIVSPFDDSYEPKIYVLDEHENCQIISLSELANYKKTVVTHNFWMLVESFRKQKIPLPTNILDLTFLSKFIIGKPKSDFNHIKPWELWALLAPFYETNKEELEEVKNIFYSKISYKENDSLKLKIQFFLRHIKSCNDMQLQELKDKHEEERFFRIELPVYNLMLNRQYNGIKYDETKLTEKIKQIESDYYLKLKKLNFEYFIDENELSNNRIYDLLKEKEAIDFTELKSYNNNEDYLDLLSENSQLAKLIQDIKRLRTDRSALLKFGSLGEDRIYPIFDTHGSVTSRIFIQDPLIQYIKKSSRDVIVADEGKKFIYADYRQFEPGILANLSGDKTLIDMYNSSDIYTSLSNAVFDNGNHRKLCKKLFLAYSFGMTQESMVKFIKLNTELIDVENKVARFFGQFKRIEEFKNELYAELLTNSKISSVFGNNRYRKFEGALKAEEKRWCLSQKVQGTASLILKNVILSIINKLPEVDILIPMHDAILVQVDSGQFETSKTDIERIFIDEYKSICSEINPKVSFEAFSEENC